MAASIAVGSPAGVIGAWKAAFITVTLDSSYPTGGEAVDFTANGEFSNVLAVLPVAGSGGIIPVWDATNSKLLAFYQDGAAGELVQATNTDDLSAESIDCLVIGV